jgi:uncharacterized protein
MSENSMSHGPDPAYIAFEGDRCIAAGDLANVAHAAKAELNRRKEGAILVFDGATGDPVEIDFRGSIGDVLARLPDPAGAPAAAEDDAAPRGPGRPKLGVVAREVTLLPRHWQWLARQRGGASVTLRRLVDEARRSGEQGARIRAGQEAAYRFMSAIAGNKPHYEEAIRALFAPEPARFEKLIACWPADVQEHSLRLARKAFDREPDAGAG